jgi:hypothetical protein
MAANKPDKTQTKLWLIKNKLQPCPQCGSLISNINGTKDAVCRLCGFKDPCCE